jgi:hypothetical protein
MYDLTTIKRAEQYKVDVKYLPAGMTDERMKGFFEEKKT